MEDEIIEFIRDTLIGKKLRLKEVINEVSKHFNFELTSSDISYIDVQYRNILAELWTSECLDKLKDNKLDGGKLIGLLEIFRNMNAFEETPVYLQGEYYKLIKEQRKIFSSKNFYKPRLEILQILNHKVKNFEPNSKKTYEFFKLLIMVLRSSYNQSGKFIKDLKLHEYVNDKITAYQLSRNILGKNFNINKYKELKQSAKSVEKKSSSIDSAVKSKIKSYLEEVKCDQVLSGSSKIMKLQKKMMLSSDLDVEIPADVHEIHVICDILHIDKNLSDSYRGNNIFVVSNTIRLHNASTWDLSGRDGKQQDSVNAGQLSNGDGKNGSDGEPGESGGNCEIFSEEIDNAELWTIKSNGGNGSNGQNGGSATKGTDGHDIQQCDFKILGQKITQVNFINLLDQIGVITTYGSRRKHFYENGLEKVVVLNCSSSVIELLMLIRGSNGKVGSIGGLGGYCGRGGFGGKVNINSEYKSVVTISENGKDGVNGTSKPNGKNGKNGRDAYLKISTSVSEISYGGLTEMKKYQVSVSRTQTEFSVYFEPYQMYLEISEIEDKQRVVAIEENTLTAQNLRLRKDERDFFEAFKVVLKNANKEFNDLVKKLKLMEFVNKSIDYKGLVNEIIVNSFDIYNYDVF